jgi:glyoxylase-like metal-dependent hydrolase (beta-lactamase superfamily II)/8-oxo-dGTP pyrophosphatase MutT (NUDIX family)
MAFAADMYVFPGGRVDRDDADPALLARAGAGATPDHVAAIRELFEETGILLADGGAPLLRGGARRALVRGETTFRAVADALDLRLATDALVPLSRWTTPVGMDRRFDTRFYAAAAPEDAVVTTDGDEVVDDVWLRPLDALEAMAEGTLAMWVPTSTTLQQLAHVRSIEDVRDRLAPGPSGSIVVDEVATNVVRIELPAGGGVDGQPVNAYLVGRRSFVLVDPGDPSPAATDRAIEEAARRGGTIRAIALTHADPDHAAGAEALAMRIDAPTLGAPGGGRHLAFGTIEVADGAVIDHGDVPLRVVATPGPRHDHLAFVVGEGNLVLIGDLDGPRGARSILVAVDEVASGRSVDRLRAAAPGATWLGGHQVKS